MECPVKSAKVECKERDRLSYRTWMRVRHSSTAEAGRGGMAPRRAPHSPSMTAMQVAAGVLGKNICRSISSGHWFSNRKVIEKRTCPAIRSVFFFHLPVQCLLELILTNFCICRKMLFLAASSVTSRHLTRTLMRTPPGTPAQVHEMMSGK